MAVSVRTWKDSLWLVWFSIQIPVILCEFSRAILPRLRPRPSDDGPRNRHEPSFTNIGTPGVDAVSLYPSWLYQPPGSPLHFLQQLRTWYIATYNDPILQWSPEAAASTLNHGHGSWIHFVLLVEVMVSLPTAFYSVYQLGFANSGTSGPQELWLLVYAFETAFTTFICIHDVSYWDDSVYSPELKNTFLFNFFTPWFVMSTYDCPMILLE
jgi:hypothetical protein